VEQNLALHPLGQHAPVSHNNSRPVHLVAAFSCGLTLRHRCLQMLTAPAPDHGRHAASAR
jgi:hypothetical protein